jgi:hypothetical protein
MINQSIIKFRYKNLIWCRWDNRLLILYKRTIFGNFENSNIFCLRAGDLSRLIRPHSFQIWIPHSNSKSYSYSKFHCNFCATVECEYMILEVWILGTEDILKSFLTPKAKTNEKVYIKWLKCTGKALNLHYIYKCNHTVNYMVYCLWLDNQCFL